MGIVKPGRVVLVLRGRYAGKKAVIVTVHDKTKEIPFQHVLLAGIEKPPKSVTKSMTKRKINNRLKIKPFAKVVNVNHVLPTRYTFKMDIRPILNISVCKDPAKKSTAIKRLKKKLRSRHIEGNPSWIFKTLRF